MHGLGDPEIAEILDDKERLKHVHADGMYASAFMIKLMLTHLYLP